MVIAKGGIPYVDAFDNKPPLIFLIAAATHFLGPWGFWLAESLAIALGAYLVLRISEQQGAREGILFSLLFLFVMRSPFLAEGGGMTRSFCALFYLGGIYALLRGSHFYAYVAGLMAALVVFLQPEELLPLLPFFLWFWIGVKDGTKKIARSLVGAIGFVGILLLWLTLSGALESFWGAIGFNFSLIERKVDVGNYPTILVRRFLELGLIYPFLFSLILLLVQLRDRTNRLWQLAVLASISLQLLVIGLTGQFYGHYFLPLIPLLLLSMIAMLRQLAPRPRAMLLLLSLLSFVVPAQKTIAQLSGIFGSDRGVFQAMIQEPWEKILRPYQGVPGTLYVMQKPEALALNTEFEIIAPSRWVYTHLWDFRPAPEFEELLRDLETAGTRFIYDNTVNRPLPGPLQERWVRFVSQRYFVHARMSDGALFLVRNRRMEGL